MKPGKCYVTDVIDMDPYEEIVNAMVSCASDYEKEIHIF